MPRDPREVRTVFDFTTNGTDFQLTSNFTTDLRGSAFAFLLMFIGGTREGKSTRANQLLNHTIRPQLPFTTDGGSNPITKGFEYVGPFKFKELSRIHKISLTAPEEADIFVIDCEGFGSLSQMTPALKQAAFALSQMASMIVFVTKNVISHTNLPHISAILKLSHAFTGESLSFAKGTAIMIREVGIRREEGKKPDDIRRQTDIERRKIVLQMMAENGVNYSDGDFLLLEQPTLDREEDLYWKSIEDFLEFAAKIASERPLVRGNLLLELFEMAKPSIMNINNFSDPQVPFTEILRDIRTKAMDDAFTNATQNLEQEVKAKFEGVSQDSLRKGPDGVHNWTDFILQRVKAFETNANKSFPGVVEDLSLEAEEKRVAIKEKVTKHRDQVLFDACFEELLPIMQNEELEETQTEIKMEMKNLSVWEYLVMSFTNLSIKYTKKSDSRFETKIGAIHEGLLQDGRFEKVSQLSQEQCWPTYELHRIGA
jgi:hypothetical protein